MNRNDKIEYLKKIQAGKIRKKEKPPFNLDNITDEEFHKFLDIMAGVNEFPISKDNLVKEEILFLEEFCKKTQAQITIFK